ncbi:hypothetical protein Dimus_019554 [Dionaea muscipula]
MGTAGNSAADGLGANDSGEGDVEVPIEKVQQWRRKNLFLEIPSRTFEISQESISVKMPSTPTPTPKRVNFSLTPSSSDARLGESPGPSSRGRTTIRSLLPKFSFKNQSSLDNEKAAKAAAGSATPQEKPSISRSLSLTKIFTPRMRRTSSLPVTTSTHPNPEPSQRESVNALSSYKRGAESYISRSLSVPAIRKERRVRLTDSFIRVIPSPRVKDGDIHSNSTTPVNAENKEPEGEDIPKEEAVCRICLVELGEGGETLKLECSCKGDLALAHQDCALKWFGIKGNKTCDVCKQEVQNLPVTLLRIQSSSHAQNSASFHAQQSGYRIWQDAPILVIVSILVYFCFLEQLLVRKMGAQAIGVSLPFSCVLGLLSSMTSSSMVKRRFIWVYASVQSAMVIVFAHVFYSLVHLQSVVSVLLATFVGFGAAMIANSMLAQCRRWRRMNSQADHRQRAAQVTQLQQD